MPDLFSPVAFFILLREAIEAGIIIAVLLGFAEQIMISGPAPSASADGRPELLANKSLNSSSERLLRLSADGGDSYGTSGSMTPIGAEGEQEQTALSAQEGELRRREVIRRMKFEIWAGALAGGATALTLGSAILVVFYLKLHDVWQSAEQLWEGIFCAIAAFLILIMGLAFLRMDHARVKWRIKLSESFQAQSGSAEAGRHARSQSSLLLFWLPFVTVLREGLEGIVFMGGVSLTETPSSIPLAAVTGIIIGAGLSRLLYSTASGQTLHTFLTTSTCLLFLIGAGLASRATGFFEQKYYIQHVGLAAAESGNGPGSFRVKGNVWAMPWGNPEPGAEGTSGFYQLANSLVGWNNVATFWTITTYILYWVFIIGYLVRRKYIEGRTSVLGRVSARGLRRQQARQAGFAIERDDEREGLLGDSDDELERTRVTTPLNEQAFLRVLQRAKRGDALGKKIRTALEVINGAIDELGEPAVAMSFNGGKDCTVLVHLLATVLFTRHNAIPEDLRIESISTADALAQDGKHDVRRTPRKEPSFISAPLAAPPPISGCTAPKTCKATHHQHRQPGSLYPPIRSVYITAPYPFQEMEEFVLDSVKVYNLDLWRFGGGMKAALEEYLKCDGGKDVKGVLVGTRRGDPNGVSVPIIAQTDPSWPQFLRIHPILHWSYKDVWDFLKELDVPWCSLYDCGYTSVGSTNNSFPNPLLKNSSAPSGWNPGWMLEDESQERAGRSDRRD